MEKSIKKQTLQNINFITLLNKTKHILIKLKIASLPAQVTKRHLYGASVLGGIGFTMSIFITLLAFKEDGEEVITYSKIAILIASFVAGTMGFFWLKFSLKNPVQESLTPQKE
mgnify:CR=1 FL=1